jgi:hypothetical protein
MTNKIDMATTVVAGADQISAELAHDEAADVVILSLKEGIYYELNPVGARVWQLIEKPCSIQSIVATLQDEFDVSAEQCEADVLSLAESLIERGLAQVVDGPNC